MPNNKAKYVGDVMPTIMTIPQHIEVPEEVSIKAAKIITRGKLRLLKHRFFGSMFLTFRNVIEHPGVGTYATDMINCYYNPFTVLKETVEDCVSSLAHETCHKILRHGVRKPPGKFNHTKWNASCDFALDAILIEEGFHLDPALFLYKQEWHGKSAEEIYMLMDDSDIPPQTPIHVFHPPLLDSEGKPITGKDGKIKPANGGQLVQMEANIDSQLINAHEANKKFGLKSKALQDIIKGLKENKVRWEDVLIRKTLGTIPENFTWKRPNRRYAGQNIILPSMEKRGIGRIYIWPDSSGSMSRDREIPAIYSEMAYILERMQPEMTVIVHLDSAIHKVSEFPQGSYPGEMDYVGGGGTDPKPFFDYVTAQGDAHMAICLTDMCFDHAIEEPPYPVIWVSTCDGDERPFGDLINIDVD